MPQKEKIVLPALVFDTLHFAALAFGGIGGGKFTDLEGDPCCIHGLAHAALPRAGSRLSNQLTSAGLGTARNDSIVARENPTNVFARVSWARYVQRGNIVRGE